MHVAGLQLFEPPDDAGPDFIRDLYDDDRPSTTTSSRRSANIPGTILGGISNVAWAFDDDIDIDYHLRRSALPRPGRVRDLLELTSRMHGTLLDRHRPLWEAHLDRGSRRRPLRRVHQVPPLAASTGSPRSGCSSASMTPDPDDREMRVPWTLGPKEARRTSAESRSPLRSLHRHGRARLPHWPLRALSVARAALSNNSSRCRSARPRRCSTCRSAGRAASRHSRGRWPAFEAVKSASGRHRQRRRAGHVRGRTARISQSSRMRCPDTPLVAMVPVSLRAEHEQDAGGNMVGTILCNLATDIEDPAERLDAISTVDARQQEGVRRPAAHAGVGVVGVPDVRHRPRRWYPGSSPRRRHRSTSSSPTCPAHANRCTGTAPDSTATTRSRSHSTARHSTSR